MKEINWQKLQQQSKKLLAVILLPIILIGSMLFNYGNAIADALTPEADRYQVRSFDNEKETRSVPEQAKNAIDRGLSVFQEATENSLEKLNPQDSPSGEAKKFYDPIEGRKVLDRDGER